MNLKKAITFLVGIIISIGSLAIVLKDVEFKNLFEIISKLSWPLTISAFIANIIIMIISFYVRAIRWKILLGEDVFIKHKDISKISHNLSLKTLFESISLGAFATFILPFRAGEFVRPAILAKDTKVSFVKGLSSCFIERVFDLSFVLIGFALLFNDRSKLPESFSVVADLLNLILVGIFVFLFLITIYRTWFLRVASYIFSITFDRVNKKFSEIFFKITEQVIEGLTSIGSFGRFIEVSLWTVLLWFFQAIPFVITFINFEIFSNIFKPVIELLIIVALSVALPSAPGFLGTFQIGVDITLTKLNSFDPNLSFAFSILNHLNSIICILGLGFFIMIRKGLTLISLKDKNTDS